MKGLIKLFAGLLLLSGIAIASPYNLDNAHSSIGFKVKHLMITNVRGIFKDFNGTIDFDAKSSSFKVFSGIVKTTSVDTGIVKRDNHLRSEDFFFSTKFPEMRFTMKSYEADGDEGKMMGDLTIRGVTKAVTLEVEDIATIKDMEGNNRVGFTIKGKINRTDFGLKWNKALEFGGFAVGEMVKIDIEIEAVEK